MPAQSCSVGDAQLRVIEVIRDQHPEWVDATGECLPCVPHELELAATTPSATDEILNRPRS